MTSHGAAIQLCFLFLCLSCFFFFLCVIFPSTTGVCVWLVLASSHTKPVGWWLVTHRRHRDEQGMGKAGLWMGVCGFHGGVWCEMTVRWCLWCVWMTKQPHTKAFKTQREREEGRKGD